MFTPINSNQPDVCLSIIHISLPTSFSSYLILVLMKVYSLDILSIFTNLNNLNILTDLTVFMMDVLKAIWVMM